MNKMNEMMLKKTFFTSSFEDKEKILNDEELYDKLMKSRPTASGRTFLDLLTNDVLELVVNSPYAKKYTKEIMIFLRNTTIRKFKEITNLIDFSWLFEDVSLDSIKEYLISKELEYNLIEQLMFKIKNNEIPMYNLLKIKNNSELLVLAKFNTLLELENKDNLICFDSENRISIDLISNLNSRHVSNLIKIFKEKNIDIDKDIVLGVIKLYCIFGYDNAYKIANDKFTYLTNSAIDRIADFRFVDCFLSQQF